MSQTTEDLFDFPDYWPSKKLGKIAGIISPGFPCGDHNQEGEGVPHLRPMNISEDGEIDLSKVKYVEEEYTPLRAGDVLFNNTNSPKLVGKTAHIDLDRDWAHSNHMTRIRDLADGVHSKWVAHWLQFLFRDGYFRMHCRNHVNQASIGVGFLEGKVDVPIPPLSEQRRIIDKIEELFSNLDAGMSDLQTADRQLERYRLSVLQAAVEGRLTADWRRTHDSEPADQLLERITEERRQFWESWYRWEKYESKGKEPPSGWKSRFKTYDQPDSAELPDVPSTWGWVQVQQVGQVQLGRQRAPEYHDGENMVPYLRVANVFEERIDTSDVKEMHFSERAYKKYKLEEGDILLNEGQSLELVGRPAMYQGTPPDCCFQNTLIRFRGYESLDRQYALLIFQGYMHTGRFADVANQTTSVAHLGSRRFSKMPFPLPPLAEQREIVQEAERLLSVADDVADTAERENVRGERLRQSILKQAFSGQLVPHEDGALPPSVYGTTSEESDTSRNDGDSDVEDLMGSADPSKQIEMDL
ncbi:restriction endonuclease subunit S [Salinibacter grassmerensis]|uniref:restriction endonuclease subunit S n=1 Tax=Salinibacter grassmerensis TaxID=3040353 RepID=UPI0021E82F74|nr:restriction endonuclease subunit S [Salinibacter grassmerensis]